MRCKLGEEIKDMNGAKGMKLGLIGNFKTTLLLTAVAAASSWSSITIIMHDGKSQPIQGISCSQYGGAPAISDDTGSLSFSPVSSLAPAPSHHQGNSLSQIPLAMGENASLTIMDIRGKI